ncbi:heme-binding protein [Asticcacaulis sp. 201]|uniref:heme-binding protein n=1 Tax=Asticcacaulis sp. 201 TaxID=3028787 RepID=UPI002916AB7B|nr:heme-binding protein [Asticcacaulis sp. 201]MDV6332298.1 heme-binding protein [Asticcacaulis sp. 201]
MVRLSTLASQYGSVAMLAAAAVAGGACAQTASSPSTDGGIALTQAMELAQAAIADCQARGYPASASVVDGKGVVKITLRADGAIKPPVAAPLKAFTAFTFDQPGAEMELREKSDAAFKALIDAHKDIYNDHAGSVPLHTGGKLIGALAVADVPHEVADACARAAVARYPAIGLK